MSLRAYIIRHGETNFNKTDKDWGQNEEEGLNDWGLLQSTHLAKVIKKVKIDKLFSSDLKRAVQTSEILGKSLGLEIISDKRLREYEPGDVEPSSEKWIEKYKQMLESGISKYEIRPFGGENIWDLIKRTDSFLKDLEKEKGNVLIVAHSGVNSALINLSQKREKNNFLKIKQDNTCINILEFSELKWKIITINDSSHTDNIKPKKEIYKNQEEIRKIAKEEVLKKLSNLNGEVYLGGDLTNKEFGYYDRVYKRYKGSPVEVYVFSNEILEVPKEWKISSLINGLEKYEIGKINFKELNHKMNVSLVKNRENFNEKNLEKIR